MPTKNNQSRNTTYTGSSRADSTPKPKNAHSGASSGDRLRAATELDGKGTEAPTSLKSDITELKQRVSDETMTVVAAVKDVAEKGEELAREASEKLSEVSHEVAGRVAEVTHEVADKAGQVAEGAQDALARAGRSIARGVKANPIPIALTGAGLAWLAVSLLRAPGSDGAKTSKPASAAAGEGTTEKLKDGASAALASVQHTVEGVAAGASELATRAGESVTEVTRSAGVSAKKLVGNVAMQGIRAERAIAASIHENPVAFGVAALATGAVIGSLLPRTRLENAWLGEQRDEVVEKAQELVRGAVEKVESAASTVAGAASSVAKSVSN